MLLYRFQCEVHSFYLHLLGVEPCAACTTDAPLCFMQTTPLKTPLARYRESRLLHHVLHGAKTGQTDRSACYLFTCMANLSLTTTMAHHSKRRDAMYPSFYCLQARITIHQYGDWWESGQCKDRGRHCLFVSTSFLPGRRRPFGFAPLSCAQRASLPLCFVSVTPFHGVQD